MENVNEIINKTSKTKETDSMKIENKIITESKKILEIINRYFVA